MKREVDERPVAGMLDAPAILCTRCRSVMVETQAVINHRINGEHRILSPLDMLAVESVGKGQMLHMKNGETIFEYLVLAELLAKYPGIFFRVNRNWLVAKDQVCGYTQDLPGHHLRLVDSDLRVPVSRREWPAVSRRLGIRIPLGRRATDEEMRIMRSHTARHQSYSQRLLEQTA